MFSDGDMLQEIAAVLVALIAFVYLVHKLAGWPSKKKPSAPVVVGERLARGLKTARK